MKVVTWNVNSVKMRLPRLLALLEREDPDVVLLQEIKVTDETFPALELQSKGYEALVYGQQRANGVAILAKQPLTEIARTFPGNPLPGEARMVAGRAGDAAFVSLYVINGRTVQDPMYEMKLAFLRAFREWVAEEFDPHDPVLIAGDFNVCSDERDLWDPVMWEGQCHFTEPERAEIAKLRDWGLVDLFRIHEQEGGHFSWWDYRAGHFHKRLGLRIDLVLGTQVLAERCTEVRIDRNERRPKAGEGAPSDHAPVIAVFREP